MIKLVKPLKRKHLAPTCVGCWTSHHSRKMYWSRRHQTWLCTFCGWTPRGEVAAFERLEAMKAKDSLKGEKALTGLQNGA